MVKIMKGAASIADFMLSGSLPTPPSSHGEDDPNDDALDVALHDIDINAFDSDDDAAHTYQTPARVNARYEIRPEMAVGPQGVINAIVYDNDDTGAYHTNQKEARKIEKELGIEEDKEAVKKRKKRLRNQERARRIKEKGEHRNEEDKMLDDNADDHAEDVESEELETVRRYPITLKLPSEQGKARLRMFGTKGNHWPVFAFAPAAEIALENIILAEGRKRKAAPVYFSDESDSEDEEAHDGVWKNTRKRGTRRRRRQPSEKAISKDCLDVRKPCSDLSEDNNAITDDPEDEGHSCEVCQKNKTGCSCANTDKDTGNSPVKGEKVYCVCRKPEKGFMIMCEGECKEWYHGSCVGVTAREARKLKQYFCKSCTATFTDEATVIQEPKTIATRYAHPIQFNFEPSFFDFHGNVPACHWCESPAYGVLGLPKMTYTVYKLPFNQGYQEVGGGHRSSGYPASRMCVSCTSARIDIAACQIHHVDALPPHEIAGNMSAALKLVRGDLLGYETESHWCSVCPEPATHTCTKEHGDGRIGCGLKLCDDCAFWLVNDHKGDLASFIETLIAATAGFNGKEETVGVRPDAIFLLSRGEMVATLFAALS